jgi:signal transduction histidine kinase
VAEAVTNVVKHAHTERAEVRVSADDQVLRVEIRDDGSEVPSRTGTGWWGWATGRAHPVGV